MYITNIKGGTLQKSEMSGHPNIRFVVGYIFFIEKKEHTKVTLGGEGDSRFREQWDS